MKELDKDTLFSIFERNDEEIYKEHGLDGTLENPYVLMGMVLTGIQNFELLDLIHLKRAPEQYKRIRKGVKDKYYNRLFNYLTRIDDTKFESIYTITEAYHIGDVLDGLIVLLNHFEEKEEYEKCMIIKNYQDLLVNSIKLDKIVEY